MSQQGKKIHRQLAEITFETRETVVLRHHGKISTGVCPFCDGEVALMSPDLLTQLMKVSEREIFRLIEAGKVFCVEGKRLIACRTCVERTLSHDLTAAELLAGR